MHLTVDGSYGQNLGQGIPHLQQGQIKRGLRIYHGVVLTLLYLSLQKAIC